MTKEKYGIEGLAEGTADEASMLPGLRGYMEVLFQEMASTEHYIGMLDQCTTDSFHVPNTTSTKVNTGCCLTRVVEHRAHSVPECGFEVLKT